MSSARELIIHCQLAGVALWARGDRLMFEADQPLPDDLLAQLRRYKADLLLLLAAEAAREDYEERAAILEHCGGLSREEAERHARELVTLRHPLPASFRLH